MIRGVIRALPFLFLLFLVACGGDGDGEAVSDLVKQGEQAFKSGDVQQALQQFEKAIEEGDESAAAFSGRGRALFEQGMYDEAVEDLNRAVELDPDNDEHLESRGLALIEQFKENADPESITQAVEDFTKAMDLRPDRVGPIFGRGEALYLQGEYEAALEDLGECVKRSDRFRTAWLIKGKTNAALGRTDAARSDFEKVIQLDPDGEYGTRAREELAKLK